MGQRFVTGMEDGSGNLRSIAIAIDPDDALADEPVRVRVTGLPPRCGVDLEWTTVDDLERRWASRATFLSDSGGTVDLGRDAPISGSYGGIDPMGWLWSMEPDPSDEPSPAFRKWTAAPLTVDVAVTIDGARVAGVELIRAFARREVEARPVREAGLVGTWFTPTGSEPMGAVIILGGSSGAVLEGMAALFASRGLAALALAYFGQEGLPSALVEVPLEYFLSALDWVERQDRVEGVGLVGISKGAEVALLLASREPHVSVVVAYCPTSHLFMGISKDMSTPTAAWSLEGRPLPFISAVPGDALPPEPVVTSDWYALALDDAPSELVESAAIPVERSKAELLLIAGKADAVWPADQFSERVVDRLSTNGGPTCRHLSFPDAGHTVGIPFMPTTRADTFRGPTRFATGGTPEGNARAAEQSWPEVVDVLSRCLAPAGARRQPSGTRS